jgi:hypothetical protein
MAEGLKIEFGMQAVDQDWVHGYIEYELGVPSMCVQFLPPIARYSNTTTKCRRYFTRDPKADGRVLRCTEESFHLRSSLMQVMGGDLVRSESYSAHPEI